ncbi:MAG: hypothetical protein Q7I92_01240 [Humidesulfovibrio sp.]|nr:hypothetical protein [Humidesulfovibrio sp.]
MAGRCKRFAPLLGLLVLVALLAGCVGSTVQGTKYTAFKDSTAVLAQDTRTSYEGVHNLWKNINAECLSTDGDVGAYERILTNQGISCGKGAIVMERKIEDPMPRLNARLQALDALVRYATMLNVLATTDYAAGVDASMAKLNASLGNLAAALPPAVPQKDLKQLQDATSVFVNVVKAAAKPYVEHKRKKALQLVLTETQGCIQTLSEKLLVDNGYVKSFVTAGRDFSMGQSIKTRPKDYENRLAYDAKVLQTYETGTALIAAVAALDKALERLPKAHAELLESLDKTGTDLERMEAFVAATEQAMMIVQQIKKI